MSKAWATLAGTVALSLTIAAQQDSYDYWGPQREMIQRGQQAIFMCNGLFTSNRTLEQVFAQELKFLAAPIGTPPAATTTSIARGRRSPSAGRRRAGDAGGLSRGIGCVILAPDQTFADIDRLPRSTMPPLAGDPATIAVARRRHGDETRRCLPTSMRTALQAASDWAFNRTSPEQVTLSLLVVQGDRSSTSATRPAWT